MPIVGEKDGTTPQLYICENHERCGESVQVNMSRGLGWEINEGEKKVYGPICSLEKIIGTIDDLPAAIGVKTKQERSVTHGAGHRRTLYGREKAAVHESNKKNVRE